MKRSLTSIDNINSSGKAAKKGKTKIKMCHSQSDKYGENQVAFMQNINQCSKQWPNFDLEDIQPTTSTTLNGGIIHQNHGSVKKIIQLQNLSNFSNIKIQPNSYVPRTIQELAVNPRKVAELKNSIINAMRHDTQVLLITGPSGSGKSTSVRIICEELGIYLFEYDGCQEYDFSSQSDPDTLKRSSLHEFLNFIEHSKFSSFYANKQKYRVLLFDQIPIVFHREPKLFREHLRTILTTQHKCILVFAFSNTESCWELNPVKIFSKNFLDSFHIQQIKFNPISNTLISKAIKFILNLMKQTPDDSFIRSVVDFAEGDIRRALNFIHFSHCSNVSNKFNSNFYGKESIEHFHFIGKIMYSKRNEQADRKWKISEDRLNLAAKNKFYRPLPPKDNLNQLISRCHLPGWKLVSIIAEHEHNFAPSFKSLNNLTSKLAECDSLFSSFEHSDLANNYLVESSIRATFFYNYSATGPRTKKLYEFTKPRFKDVEDRRSELHSLICDLYPSKQATTLKTIVLPTLVKINSVAVSSSQAELCNKISFSPKPFNRLQLQNEFFNTPKYKVLDEKIPIPTQSQVESCSSCDLGDGFSYDIEED